MAQCVGHFKEMNEDLRRLTRSLAVQLDCVGTCVPFKRNNNKIVELLVQDLAAAERWHELTNLEG